MFERTSCWKINLVNTHMPIRPVICWSKYIRVSALSPTLEAIAQAAYQTLLLTSNDPLSFLWFVLLFEVYGFPFMFFDIAEMSRPRPKNSSLREPINPSGARYSAEAPRRLWKELPAFQKFQKMCGGVRRIPEEYSFVKSTALWQPSSTV